jgi:nucleoside-diphosphate-sugar epimerase
VLAAFGESRESWEFGHEGVQLGDQRRAAADIAAISALGWSPQVSFADGVGHTVEWARAQHS